MSITNETTSFAGAQTEPQPMPLTAAFPPDFLWGAATSAYQVEGAVQEDGRSPSIWDRFASRPGAVFQGETGAIATDHYHRMEADVALMASLHLGAYRFSISWPRVLPQGTGAVNGRGLDFYERLVDTLLAHGITPLATLYHWDLPQALEDRGGWLARDTAQAFADYAEVVTRRLGDRVTWWLTHNEPWCSSYLSYALGMHAPGLHDKQLAVNVGHHILLSHGLAVPRMRAQLPEKAQVGIALDFYPVYAVDERPETLQAVKRADTFRNRWFLDPVFRGCYPENLFSDLGVQPPPASEGDLAIIAAPLDFLGVNYYSRMLVREHHANASVPQQSLHPESYEAIEQISGSAYTQMGWEIFPSGLANILTRIHHEYGVQALVVTENGAAFEDHWDGHDRVHDQQRIDYLRMHIQTLAEVRQQGVPVQGYCVWSLLDNFEWAQGYCKRFGLVYVDYPSQRRIVKDSGHWYANFIRRQRELHGA
ncbi:MAG TPA: GH1 family beta-glucosidase [Ktedonobacteraceae bacterium]|jgi:beta-glucosidase